jgi:isoaspartyl peptidase/L-asparaginase-like protein (Ntn-hydrolase superfamily)
MNDIATAWGFLLLKSALDVVVTATNFLESNPKFPNNWSD